MRKPEVKLYLNAKQIRIAQATQKRKVWIGGRGTGKSTLQGFHDLQRIMAMPRAKWFKAGLTYNQLLTKILPEAIKMWQTFGLVEQEGKRKGHFVIGRKPPLGWELPWSPPRRYENVVSFWNGCCIELISIDNKDTSRGGSYDGGDFDEAVLISKDQHDKELRPMIRGNTYRYNHHLHQASLYTSSQSWLPSGNWVPDMALDAVSFPEEVFYIESTSWDNIDVLGRAYLQGLKRDLPPAVYAVEVMNERVSKLPNAFYPALDLEKSCYDQGFEYGEGEKGIYTLGPSDVRSDLPFEITFDFGSFNSLEVIQLHGTEFRVVNCLEVNNPKILDDLVDMFIDTYKNHKRKHVDIYGDRNGNNRQANSSRTLYEDIKARLAKAGWSSRLMVQGLDPAHALKYDLINKALRGEETKWPRIRFNKQTCKHLLLSMGGAAITHDGKKDKRSERTMASPELATHHSDAFDNWCYRRFKNIRDGRTAPAMEPGFA